MPGSYKRKRAYSSYGVNKRSRMGGIIGKYAPYALNLAGRYLYGRSAGRTQTTSGQGVTTQYDRKVVYRKKTMPRRKKRQWKNFVNKVNAALMKSTGSRTIIRNTQLTYTDATDAQGRFAIALYGKDGSNAGTSAGFDDLRQIFTNDSLLSDQTSRAKFSTGILDLTIVNNSSVTDASVQNTSVELDVYEFVMTKKNDSNNLITLFNTAATNTGLINGLNSEINLFTRGATPFDLPDALAQGVKILKKTKLMLGSGQCATYQMRMAKNYTFRRDIIVDNDFDFAIPWVTKGVLVIVKGVPTGDATKVLKSVQFGVTRKYLYKVVQANLDGDNVIP